MMRAKWIQFCGNASKSSAFSHVNSLEEKMRNHLFAAALIGAMATPAFGGDVGVHVGPAGAGVTTGESHRDRTVIREREPSDSKTVIKKQDEYGNREKKVIQHDRY
jgi:hypothetical protein